MRASISHEIHEFRCVSAYKAVFPIKAMARVKVLASGYYVWRGSTRMWCLSTLFTCTRLYHPI
jgi:hypothetical protein